MRQRLLTGNKSGESMRWNLVIDAGQRCLRELLDNIHERREVDARLASWQIQLLTNQQVS